MWILEDIIQEVSDCNQNKKEKRDFVTLKKSELRFVNLLIQFFFSRLWFKNIKTVTVTKPDMDITLNNGFLSKLS